MIPCIMFEDEDLLVVNKPAGWNTHAPSPHAGEGIYDWLRHREPRWAELAILHRLDKETSGLLVFGKSRAANRSLTRQFTEHRVQKRYWLLTDRPAPRRAWKVQTCLARCGSRYASVSGGASGELAETQFTVLSTAPSRTLLQAEPLTGRTHQIRVHAAESGVPILGDTLYGGSHFQRVCLHAAFLALEHPASGRLLSFEVPADFEADPCRALRSAITDPGETDAYRLVHGAADGWPGWSLDRLGSYLLSQSEEDLTFEQDCELRRWVAVTGAQAAYHKPLSKTVRRALPETVCPQLMLGVPAPERFSILENGRSFELGFGEGYSVGLFLDQRDNRRRLLTGEVAAGFALPSSRGGSRPWEVLNVFAYTCGFSVCAAVGGARVTSVDLSRKYLDWGRRNFELNGLDPAGHEFLFGDAFDWMKRLHKKGRRYTLVILDPPTFSQSRQSGVFRAEQDYGKLAQAAVRLLRAEGVLFTSTNAAQWDPAQFLETVRTAIRSEGRSVLKERYAPQPPDFPISREQPGFLKTAWFEVG
ncbi:MAG: pseudouridine synthase [Verrucomicrobia bacterium]|nr:pseudouridine synthase [Verrucomicrobiota bacterium]